jgi:hypothetical protein
MAPPEDPRKVSFYVERDVTEQLAKLARRADRTLSAEIRRACREHVSSQRGSSPSLDTGGAAGGVASSASSEDA